MLNTALEICADESRIHAFLLRNSSLFSPPLSARVDLGDYAKKLSKKALNIFLTHLDQDVAHAAVYVNGSIENPAFLSSFCIDHLHQRKGLGSQLLEYVLRQCERHGISQIDLEVSIESFNARSFYAHHGFEEITQDGSVMKMRKMVSASTSPVHPQQHSK